MAEAGRRERLRRAAAGDSGHGILELVLAMSLLTVITAFAFAVLTGAVADDRRVRERVDAVGQVRIALSTIDRQVRSGSVLIDPVACTDAGALRCSMRVYTQVDGLARCVQWQVHSRTLRSRTWSPQWRTDGTASGWSVVAKDIDNDRVDAARGVQRLEPFVVDGGSGSTAQFVRVQLRSVPTSLETKPVLLSGLVSGRNTNYGYSTGICDDQPPA